jgi:hypothetical protein
MLWSVAEIIKSGLNEVVGRSGESRYNTKQFTVLAKQKAQHPQL